MGANATTFVPSYTSGEVLTAANLTVTNSGIPVFADSTARTAAFGGTGEKTLAEGQYAYLESDNSTSVYDGAAWQPVGASGLVRVGGGTLSGSSTAFTNVFSSTYHAYKIVLSDAKYSTTAYLQMILGATTTGYVNFVPGQNATTGAFSSGFMSAITANWTISYGDSLDMGATYELVNPNLAKRTQISGGLFNEAVSNLGGTMYGTLNNTTQYTGFTLSTSAGTITGTINIYGYALS